MLPTGETDHLVEQPMETNFSLPSAQARASVTGRSVLVLVVATLLVPLAAHFSSADPTYGQRTQNVQYEYRDVASAARVPALYLRFQLEAMGFCERLDRTSPVDPRRRVDCAERVVDRAVRWIDAPELTAYHEARQDRTTVTRVARAG
jgi:UrcA family protein